MRGKNNTAKPIVTVDLKQSANNNIIQKKTQEVNKRKSTVTKRARELFKKNLHFFMKGKFPHQANTHLPLLKDSESVRLPNSDEEDSARHLALSYALTQQHALHASATWQNLASISQDNQHSQYHSPPVINIPKRWKDTLRPMDLARYNLDKKQIQFQELIYEIILTEQSYLDDLILTYKVFIADSIAWPSLPKATKDLFESLHQIIIMHVQFVMALKARQSMMQLVYSITDIFRSFAPRFEIYSAYFANFEKATNEITHCIETQNEFGSFITRRQAWQECRNLPITAFLLTPIQRVMKYPLFFNSLLECLDANDFRVPELNSFIGELDVILRHFEQQQKDAEDFAKLEDLQRRIKCLGDYHLAQPGRKLLYEGYLKIHCPDTSSCTATSSSQETPDLQRRSSITSQRKSSLFRRNSTASSQQATPSLLRRSSTFSSLVTQKKEHKRAYVFLFNDLILFTKVSKEKCTPKSTKKGSYHGISPTTMYKMLHLPGKVTFLSTTGFPNEQKRRESNTIFDLFRQQQEPETNPTQFYASISTVENTANLHLEADSVSEKLAWCGHFATVILENNFHPKPPTENVFEQKPQQIAFFFEDSGSSDSESSSCYSEEETMEIVEEKSLVSPDTEDIFTHSSIADTFFTDSIWSVGSVLPEL